MRMHEITNSVPILITNEENDFVSSYGKKIHIGSLDEHDKIIARNLVRKGVYKVSDDNQNIIKND